MKKLMKKQKNNKGITLLSLVITVIIIIILSTIIMNTVMGDNGIIKKSTETKDKSSNLIIKENSDVNKVMQEYANSMAENIEIPDPVLSGEIETGGTVMESMTNGVIEIEWLSGTSNTISETPNPPKIKNGLPSRTTMELVKFNSNNNTWEEGTEYNYIPGVGNQDNTSSKWANARVTINGIESYFVWIPRYAYRIVYFNSEESKREYQEGKITEAEAVKQGKIIGYSDSRGIVDSSGKKIKEIMSASNTDHLKVNEKYFQTHPAFTNDIENGGWSNELEGIWIAKFESSSVEGNDETLSNNNVTTKTVKVQPGYESWHYINFDNAFTVSKEFSTELNSHLLKNSEWGAVVYLTESKYGRNGTEVECNTEQIAGGGTGISYAYTNNKQSSTGNVYGIYDLSGGHFEQVAGYYKNYSNYSSILDGTNTKYYIAYYGKTKDLAYKYGDATYETSEWHNDDPYFFGDIKIVTYYIIRGGCYYDGGGIFSTYCSDSKLTTDKGFRIAITV